MNKSELIEWLYNLPLQSLTDELKDDIVEKIEELSLDDTGDVIIDPEETTKDGIETVKCGNTFQMLGRSFLQDGVRYFVPICPHPQEHVLLTVRGRHCSLCGMRW